jgi:hypothetical protein
MQSRLSNILLTILIVGYIGSCSNLSKVEWSPDPYVGDSTTGSIINSDGDLISCFDPQIDEYAAISSIEWQELAAILTAARIPRRYKKDLEEKLKEIRSKLNRAVKRKLPSNRTTRF